MDSVLSPVTQVLLIDTNDEADLASLLEHRSAAMLPVGGKPLIQFWCERLNLAGIRRLHLLLRHFPDQVRAFVGGGERWGLEVGISSFPDDIGTEEALRLAQAQVGSRCLLASIASLPLAGLHDWLQAASRTSAGIVATDRERDLLSTLVLAEPADLPRAVTATDALCVPPRALPLRPIRTARDLWQANMDLLTGVIDDPLPSGHEDREGVLLDMGAKLRSGIKLTPPCRIGRHSLVQSQIKLGPQVVIGANCIIEEASELTESVVFDNTFIGSHSELHRVLADGRLVYRVDQDVATWIDDPLIIGSRSSKSRDVGLGQRLLATLLLLCLGPLLGLRALAKLLFATAVWERETIFIPIGRDLSGTPQFQGLELYSLADKNPHWRKLPWMWHTIKGELALFGISPRREAEPSFPAWAQELICERPGIITLADVTGVATQGETGEDLLVTDSYYVATRSYKRDAALLGRWLTGLFARPSAQGS